MEHVSQYGFLKLKLLLCFVVFCNFKYNYYGYIIYVCETLNLLTFYSILRKLI